MSKKKKDSQRSTPHWRMVGRHFRALGLRHGPERGLAIEAANTGAFSPDEMGENCTSL